MHYTRYYLILVILLTNYSIVFSQSNTPCNGAGAPNIAVNGSCTFQTGNNNSATQQTNANNGGTPSCGAMGPDVWYSFTAPASGNVTITIADITIGDAVMALYSGTCGPTNLTELNCSDDVNGLMPEITNAALTPGNTYFIRIWGFGGATGSFDICVVDNGGGGGGGLANDTPCTATPLTVNASCIFTAATNVGGTDSGIANPGCASYSGGPDAWFSVTVPASGNITVETGAAGITDGGLAIYSGPCGSPTLLQCDDDGGTGTMEQITLYGQTPGATLFIRVWEFGGGTGTFNICASEPPAPPSNVFCGAPDPICSGTPISFTAQAVGVEAAVLNPGNDYDCLFTSPNPTWYYLEIATGGNLVIDITAGSDIDFAIWGPYADLATGIADCNSYPTPQDCSYSTAAIEQAVVNGVVAGEVYILLVTNFANTVQTINVNEAAANTASTDCSIVPLPVELANFSGAWKDNEIHLSWITSSELDNSHFVVERSKNGSVWSAFDIIDGVGSSTSVTNYTSIDRHPHAGLNYYRLKQFDLDGTIRYSDIIAVSAASNPEVQLFPNPTKDNVIISASDFFSRIQITDARGAVLVDRDYQLIQQTTLDLSTLKNGIYYVSIYSENGTSVERLVVHH